MAEQSRKEFGKRLPQPPAPVEPPVKRSSHVALLLMGTFAVGGAAYALMPHQDCTPATPAPGMAQPAMPQANATTCRTWRSSGGGYTRSSRFGLFGGDTSGRSSSGVSSSDASSSSVTRGGFGAIAHAFGFSGRS